MSKQQKPQHFQVRYPAGVTPSSHGGNGYLMTSGIDIAMSEQHVELRPITSRGHTASSCHIRIPPDKDTLLALANQLRDIAMVM
jgi:hypothetical protein